MDSIANLINKRQVEKISSERGELLKFFRERVRDRKGKMYGYPFLAVKLSHLSVQDLVYLKSVCMDAENRGRSFGKVFWGSIKVQA